MMKKVEMKLEEFVDTGIRNWADKGFNKIFYNTKIELNFPSTFLLYN